MSFCFHKIDAVLNLLALRKIVISSIRKADRNKIVYSLPCYQAIFYILIIVKQNQVCFKNERRHVI